MLAKVKRPDSAEVSFKYDALGRRISKRFRNIITRWTWDGNVPLHEQKTQYWRDYEKERGEFLREDKQPLVTWVFEEGTFVPVARITEKQQLSIVTNYLGTPEAMYREDGEAVWTCELNSYGKVRNFQGEFKTDCPFRYQGQYEDSETGLFYNRFRYYDAEVGVYISQDPIGLEGNNPTLYSYVHNTNSWIDIFGCNIYTPIVWTAPSSGTGQDYTVFQQNIDWDQKDKKGRTNLERASKGKAPLGPDGKSINLHHSKQNAKGPLFELSESTHRKYDRTNALHPYKVDGSGKHPINPVNRKAFGKDRKQYWKDRSAVENERRQKAQKGKCS
jgi:RHS repeat-associated protein